MAAKVTIWADSLGRKWRDSVSKTVICSRVKPDWSTQHLWRWTTLTRVPVSLPILQIDCLDHNASGTHTVLVVVTIQPRFLVWVVRVLIMSIHCNECWDVESHRGRESRGAGKLRELATRAKKPKNHRPFYPQEGLKFDENKSHLTRTKLILSALCKAVFWRGIRLRSSQYNTAPPQNLSEQENWA